MDLFQTKQPSRFKILIRDLIDAIRGSEIEYTEGSIGRAIFLLAIPMMLEMIMESVFAVVDVYFVSSLGASAIATVGLTESVLTLMYAVAMGLAMATTAMVARRIGEKHKEQAAETAVQAILLGIIVSIPFSIVGLLFSKNILSLMGADPWIINEGYRYMVWLLGGNVVIMLLFMINAIFRGAGDAAIAMRVLWLANGINIILDPALIFGWGPFPELGLEGASVATTIGRGVGVLTQLFVLFHGGKHIKVAISQIRLGIKIIGRLVKTALGGIGQFLIATSSWIFLVRIVSEFGSEALAGYTIAVRIFMFTMMPSWGLANAAATLVGQNLGADQPERAQKSVWITAIINVFFLGFVSIIYIVYDQQLIGIFTREAGVIAAGAQCLRILSYGYPIYGLGMVVIQSFNGAGDTMTPTKINFVFFWLFEIPLAYVLALKFGFDEGGVYWAIFLAESSIAITAFILFRRGKWKEMKV